LSAAGVTFDSIVERVAQHFDIPIESILAPGKQPLWVKARSVVAYLAIRQLGLVGTEVGKRLGVSQSAVSRAVERGEALAAELSISLPKEKNA
jgi:putative transposase